MADETEDQRPKKSKFDRLREREISDIRAVLSTVSGRRFVWSVLESTGMGQNAFSTNALAMASNVAKQSVGLTLTEALKDNDLTGYLLMHTEAHQPKEDPNA